MTKYVYQIKKNELGKRLDIFLKEKMANLSRNKIITLIKQGKVKANKKIILTPSVKLDFLGQIEVFYNYHSKINSNEEIELDIVFEDTVLIVVNKPAGILTHSSEGNISRNLVDILLKKNVKLQEGKEKKRAGVVHRLDKDTSGLIVFAKTKLANEFLAKQFFLRKVNKIYEAIVWGKPSPLSGKIDLPIAKHGLKKKATLKADAKKALTDYKTLKTNGFFSLVECKIYTGRTHQIRVHMLALKCPLVGDNLYSRGRNLSHHIPFNKANVVRQFKRQALHAVQLGFKHPLTKKDMIFKAKKTQDIIDLENTLFNDE